MLNKIYGVADDLLLLAAVAPVVHVIRLLVNYYPRLLRLLLLRLLLDEVMLLYDLSLIVAKTMVVGNLYKLLWLLLCRYNVSILIDILHDLWLSLLTRQSLNHSLVVLLSQFLLLLLLLLRLLGLLNNNELSSLILSLLLVLLIPNYELLWGWILGLLLLVLLLNLVLLRLLDNKSVLGKLMLRRGELDLSIEPLNELRRCLLYYLLWLRRGRYQCRLSVGAYHLDELLLLRKRLLWLLYDQLLRLRHLN